MVSHWLWLRARSTNHHCRWSVNPDLLIINHGNQPFTMGSTPANKLLYLPLSLVAKLIPWRPQALGPIDHQPIGAISRANLVGAHPNSKLPMLWFPSGRYTDMDQICTDIRYVLQICSNTIQINYPCCVVQIWFYVQPSWSRSIRSDKWPSK